LADPPCDTSDLHPLTTPVFLPVIVVTLAVYLLLVTFHILSLLLLLEVVAALVALEWSHTTSLWSRQTHRPWQQVGLHGLGHRLLSNSSSRATWSSTRIVWPEIRAALLQPLRAEEIAENPVHSKGELHQAAAMVSSRNSIHFTVLEVVTVCSEVSDLAVSFGDQLIEEEHANNTGGHLY
jgi:hypothetical protein